MVKILIAILVATIIGVGIYVFPRENDPQPVNQQSATGTPAPNQMAASPNEAEGNYINYSDDAIANTSGEKILFFHAPWCIQCRTLETDIQNGPVPDGVTIIKVDYDSMQELRKKYGVTLQTTLVKVDDQGALIKKYVAYDSPTLDSLIKNLL